MASKKVTYDEWVKSGIYPSGSPGKNAGKPFDPSDPNLKSYYDNYGKEWDAGDETKRAALNKQHGFAAALARSTTPTTPAASGYKPPTVTPAPPGSETERVDVKQTFGTPLAESIRTSMIGEVKGLGERSEKLAAMDREREFDDAILAQAQQFASAGMSFSTPMLHAEEDMIRDLAKDRLVDADEAANLQKQLDMARWEAAEPIQRLAAEAKLGEPGTGLNFKPGAFKERLLDIDIGSIKAGVPKTPPEKEIKEDLDPDKESTPQPTDHYTDSKGNTCYYEDSVEKDGKRTCPPGSEIGGGTI